MTFRQLLEYWEAYERLEKEFRLDAEIGGTTEE